MNRRFLSRLALAQVFLAMSHSVAAQGGPPLLTDDPDTPGNRHWEINTAYTVERVRDDAGRAALGLSKDNRLIDLDQLALRGCPQVRLKTAA